MHIGFIGVGVMGSRMVNNLLKAGYQVSVYNRSPDKTKALIELGAVKAVNIAEIAQNCHVICTCLSMPEDALDVYMKPEGVLENTHSNHICIDFTTIGPETSNLICEKANEKGISYLDAPVSGGPEGADKGTLTIMVGGDQKAYESVYSVLKTMGESIHYLGLSGSGSVAKLMNQYLVAVHSIAASEVMVTGTVLGLNPEQLYDILKASYGDSRMLRRHMENFVLDRHFEAGGAVKYIHKDVKLANQLFEKAGLSEYTGKLAELGISHAMEQGLSELDMSAVIQPLEKICNVVVKRH